MAGYETTTCCIAGCGPAGAMLGLVLARAGVDVVVLEKHGDFLRDFRGDTIHPSTIEILDELGLFDRFDRLPQRRAHELKVMTDAGTVTLADFRELGIRYPYIAFVPQRDFLDFLTDAARSYPTFALRMESEAVEVVRAGKRVVGFRYRAADGLHEVRSALSVAADGRSSATRASAGLQPVRYGAPVDVLWFRLTRRDSDPDETFGRPSAGRMLVMINRTSYWQGGFVIPKGSAAELRGRGLEAFRSSLAELVPFLADRVGGLASWDDDVKVLEVQVDRLRRWYLPGLLCIGDAAHAMSPIGGVGINLAVQDAVAAANLLTEPLLRGTLTERDLRRIQRQRWLPTVVTQLFQRAAQRRLLGLLRGHDITRIPAPVRALAQVGPLRRAPVRLIAVGVRPEHVTVGRTGRPAR